MATTSVPTQKKGSGVIVTVLIVILLASTYFIYRLYQQNEGLKKSNSELEVKSNSSDSILNQINNEQKIIGDSNVAIVNLVGTKAAPSSRANVYWDSTASAVYLVVKNMPQLPSDAQYQLWALIDGKPADLGVFDAKNDKVLLKMKDTKKADAFAITIEKKGGNPSPTLEKLQSIGKTKSL